MFIDYAKLGIGNLLHRRLRSWLTMIGIVIGITAIIILVSLGQGLEDFVLGQFSLAGTDVIGVQAAGTGNGPPGTGAINPLQQRELDRIRQIAGVDVAIGRIVPSGNIEYNDVKQFGFAQSIPDTAEERRAVERVLNLEMQDGRYLRDGDSYQVVLGADFADDDLFGEPVLVGRNVLINGVSFEVVGILKAKGSFVLDGSALVPERTLREITDTPDGEYDLFAIKVQDVDDIQDIKEQVERVLRKERDVKEGQEDFSVTTPEEALGNLEDTLFAVQLFVYIIAGISLVVGGIGIMNTMYTAVLERTKEIGIMKAIGASTRDIFSIFFIESGVLGMVGGIAGVLIGVAVASGITYAATNIFELEIVQASFSPLLIFGSLAFSFILGSLAGFLPALQAAKLHPVDALGYAK